MCIHRLLCEKLKMNPKGVEKLTRNGSISELKMIEFLVKKKNKNRNGRKTHGGYSGK